MSTSDPSLKSDSVQAKLQEDSQPTSSDKMNTVSRRSRESNFSQPPDEFPEDIQLPKYAIGDHCHWVPMNTSDWGTIVGQVLTPVKPDQSTTSHWVWLYLVLLDLDSPSRRWVTTDWAEEDDLERKHPPA